MVSPTDARIGTELVGYRIEALLGRGGTSIVYRADDARLDRKVALKLLAPALADDERFRERFLRESKLAASIEHPNIVPVYDAGEADGLLYIAVRYVPGEDLKTLLQREGPLEPERALSVVAQVGAALDVAHERGLVHRDVKPSNVLVAPGDHVYLSDFGLTKSASDRSALTTTGQLIGTVDYIAPEQIEGRKVDGRADLYSLACVLYECLTGKVPFPRDSELAVLWSHVNDEPPKPSDVRPDLPRALDGVVAKAFAKDPAARYATGRAFVDAARAAIAPLPTRRRPRGAWAVTGAATVVAVAAVVAIVLARGGSTIRPLTNADSVARIDPNTNRLVAAIKAGRDPLDVAAGFGNAYVVSSKDQTVYLINAKANAVVAKASLAPGSGNVSLLAVAAGAHEVWVTEGPASALVATRYSRLPPIPLGTRNASTEPVAVTVGAGAVWAATLIDERVWRVDPDIQEVVASIPLDYRPSALAFGAGALWVATLDHKLLRIDPKTNKVVATRPLSFTPGGIDVDAGNIWLTNPVADTVVRLDPNTNERQSIPVGSAPSGIAVGAGAVWVANNRDGTVMRIDPASHRVVATVNVGPHPRRVAVGAGGVWVAVGKG